MHSFLGNIQRNGTFSVIPRMAAGEVKPEQLIVIGQIAKEYDLCVPYGTVAAGDWTCAHSYTKITGGQRIDMFGAKKQDLPDIWVRTTSPIASRLDQYLSHACIGAAHRCGVRERACVRQVAADRQVLRRDDVVPVRCRRFGRSRRPAGEPVRAVGSQAELAS
jgi:hypothetical protein